MFNLHFQKLKCCLIMPHYKCVVVGVYTAPELYMDEIFDKSVDVFSFAIIVYEVYTTLSGHRPPILCTNAQIV